MKGGGGTQNLLNLLHCSNRLVISPHQTPNPRDTNRAAIKTKMHIKMHTRTSMNAEKNVESLPRRKNLTNLPNWMREMTNMMTATNIVKLQ